MNPNKDRVLKDVSGKEFQKKKLINMKPDKH